MRSVCRRRLERRYERLAARTRVADTRPTPFHLSTNILTAVHAYCGEFNKRLGQKLERDLVPLGY